MNYLLSVPFMHCRIRDCPEAVIAKAGKSFDPTGPLVRNGHFLTPLSMPDYTQTKKTICNGKWPLIMVMVFEVMLFPFYNNYQNTMQDNLYHRLSYGGCHQWACSSELIQMKQHGDMMPWPGLAVGPVWLDGENNADLLLIILFTQTLGKNSYWLCYKS